MPSIFHTTAVFFAFFFSFASVVLATSPYREHLFLRPLPHNLLASFEFQSNATVSSIEQQNYRFFPRSLSQILSHAHTRELHLRFTSGRWNEETWGPQPQHGAKEGGTGIEMWAWVEGDTEEEAYTRWRRLVNSLSGLFCASLNYMDSTRTIRPVAAYEPAGSGVKGAPNLHLLQGALPREVVCTENLTPFMKLLPCKGKSGISTLLDGHKIFDAAWQSMAIDVRPICEDGSPECILEMSQSVHMVLDLERSMRSKEDPIPRPVPEDQMICDPNKYYHNYGDSCYPVQKPPFPNFSLSQVFGKQLKGTCALIDDDPEEKTPSSICIDALKGQEVGVKTDGHSKKYEQFVQMGDVKCFQMPRTYQMAVSRSGQTLMHLAESEFDIEVGEADGSFKRDAGLSLLDAERTMTGYGQQRGGLQSVFRNPSTNTSIDFVYLESLPWFMKPFLHTLRTDITPLSPNTGFTPAPDINPVRNLYYRPAIDRKRAAHIEVLLSIPPASTLTFSYDFEKSILRYTEYPPDANRGFDVAPAVIKIMPPQQPGQQPLPPAYARTTSLLLYAASPDFSMPYNVIILTSTVIALGFGSIFNIIIRRFVGTDEADAVRSKSLKERLLTLALSLNARFAPKPAGKTE